ncbi:hypothetical protein GALL_513000 [mine drainage metagenome]|uniref:Uncharacterized protein n=1 Tax=mine drainage metagenome TaxID=410659 RepID=A0A1J5PPA4_9ZZZZ
MHSNNFIFSANLRVIASQAMLHLRSPMNTDPDPVDLPILGDIAALTARAKAEFERLIREHRGYGVGDTVQHSYERSLGSNARKFRVLGFAADPDLDVVILLAPLKKNGEASVRVTRQSIFADMTLVSDVATEAA